MDKEITYGDIVNIIKEHRDVIETRFDLVTYIVGYYGELDNTVFYFVEQAHSDGFVKS